MTPGTSPQAKATSDLIATLHDDTIPAAERGTTLRVYIGGITATYADFATVVAGKRGGTTSTAVRKPSPVPISSTW